MTIVDANELDGAPAPESYVYMFYSGGKIKIGTSKDPARRLDQLNNSSSFPVQIVWLSFGGSPMENTLHRLFDDDRLHGEWFTLSDEIRDFINASGSFSLYLRAAENTWNAYRRRSGTH